MLSKDEILEVLTTWNYWDSPLPKTVKRPAYEQEIARKAKTGEIVILKGVRRSGKSTLLINEIKRLTAEVDIRNILYVNFEDPRLIRHLNVELMEAIKETYLEFIQPSGKPYFFFDEVQNLPAWEKWILKEYATRSAHIYVTGSSSSLLSREIGTALSGRYLDVTVLPLSFREYLHFNDFIVTGKQDRVRKKTDLNRAFRDYLVHGGFPKLTELQDRESKQDLLKNYFDSILLRDIVSRHNFSNYRALEEMAVFLLSHNSTLSSTNKLKNLLGVSFVKARDYITMLEESCLIFQLSRFSWSLKKQLANARKFYAIDVGLANRVSFQVGSRQGQNLENIVFLELIRRGHEVYYYRSQNDHEIDFLIKQGRQLSQLIQVSYSLQDEQTRKRELNAFKPVQDELGLPLECTVLTLDRNETVLWQGLNIEIVNVIDWLVL